MRPAAGDQVVPQEEYCPMDDLTGLGKLAESQVVNEVYGDIAKSAATETGRALEDTVKAFRLFMAPIQLLAVAQDRLARFCDRVRKDVPPERQIEARPSIAIPILLALRNMEDDNPLTDMFTELLRNSIDSKTVELIHPAFPKIIEQLCGDEAVILYSLREMGYMCILTDTQQSNSFPLHRLTSPDNLHFNCRHLAILDLVDVHANAFVQLAEFGRAFIAACVPEHIDGIPPFCREP
jgi:hypothetical protein